jgi:uncharacterized protein (TIGR02266 family)
MSRPIPIRRHHRHRIALRVRLRMDTWEQAVCFVSKNISSGGMFLPMADPAPRGTRLRLSIELPGGASVDLLGQVQHSRSRAKAEAVGREPGVGIRFLELDGEHRKRLDRVLAGEVPKRNAS